jgi:hypothetical protein
MRLLLSITLTLLSAPIFASSWNCSNKDLEIHCSPDKCEVADGFTPMSISLNTDGTLSICAYSGCWEGNGMVMKFGNHVLVSGKHLQWTGTNPGTADFMVAVDTSDNVGFIKGEGFAMPTICTQP